MLSATTAPPRVLPSATRGREWVSWIGRFATHWEERIGAAGAALGCTFGAIIGNIPNTNQLPAADIDPSQAFPVIKLKKVAAQRHLRLKLRSPKTLTGNLYRFFQPCNLQLEGCSYLFGVVRGQYVYCIAIRLNAMPGTVRNEHLALSINWWRRCIAIAEGIKDWCSSHAGTILGIEFKISLELRLRR